MQKQFFYPFFFLIFSLLSAVGLFSNELNLEKNRKTGETGSDFLRFVQGKNGAKLQTAIISYKKDDRITVHLVSTVHIGDKEYYKKLNRIFSTYDVLLFEMIGRMKKRKISGAKRKINNSVTMIQVVLKDFLELHLQTDVINYNASNFVHADMDLPTFYQKQQKLGKGFFGLTFLNTEKYRQELRRRNIKPLNFNIVDIFQLIFSYDSSRELKLILAPYLDKLIDVISAVEMRPDSKSILIHERNRICMQVLKKMIARGKKNIGIFYGAAHMPDMEKKLCRGLGFQKVKTNWLTAWNITNE